MLVESDKACFGQKVSLIKTKCRTRIRLFFCYVGVRVFIILGGPHTAKKPKRYFF